MLVSRPDVARGLGARARAWVEYECNWESVAKRYADFLTAIVEGEEAPPVKEVRIEVEPAPEKAAAAAAVPGEYIASWAPVEDGSRAYVESHLTRLEKTLQVTPRGGPEDRILEMGAYLQITPALKTKLGYGEVRGCYYGPLGEQNTKIVTSDDGEEFE